MKISLTIAGLMIGLFIHAQSAPAAVSAPAPASTPAPAPTPAAALAPGEHDHSGLALPRMFSHEHGLRVRSKPSARQPGCPIATDQTYGLTLENPVLIGGDVVNGIGRKMDYMRILRGSHGGGLEIYRLGAAGSNGQIVDVYEVVFADGSKSVLLFLNEYAYADPKIPFGFTCSEKIPFGSPD